jgi:hypothetical protein
MNSPQEKINAEIIMLERAHSLLNVLRVCLVCIAAAGVAVALDTWMTSHNAARVEAGL